MNLFENSPFNNERYMVIEPLNEKFKYFRVMNVDFINNTTNYHSVTPTKEIIELSEEEFKFFKKIELKKPKTNFDSFNIKPLISFFKEEDSSLKF